ncbi:MAG TPA: ABC transporter substrate-binding protein [Burkholderiales bacterium]|nr:ABC transporter substrate-binding protein [Burkholderiales bacterium]
MSKSPDRDNGRRNALKALSASALAASGLFSWGAHGQQPEIRKVALGQAKSAGQSAQIPLAIANNMFAADGLEVSISYFNSAAEMNEALVGGALNITATGDVPAIGLMAAKGPAKCLAPLADFSIDQALVVKKAITNPKQLEGAKLGLTKGTVATMLIELYAKRNGLDTNKLGLIHMSAPDQIPAFISGDIDGIVSWEPWVWTALQKVPGAHVMQRGPGLFTTYNLLLVHEPFLAKNPNTVKAVLRTLLRANDEIHSTAGERAAAKSILANEAPGMPEDVLLKMIEARKYTMTIDPTLVDGLQKMTDFLYSVQRINRRASVSEWLVPGPLREVRPSLVKI